MELPDVTAHHRILTSGKAPEPADYEHAAWLIEKGYADGLVHVSAEQGFNQVDAIIGWKVRPEGAAYARGIEEERARHTPRARLVRAVKWIIGVIVGAAALATDLFGLLAR